MSIYFLFVSHVYHICCTNITTLSVAVSCFWIYHSPTNIVHLLTKQMAFGLSAPFVTTSKFQSAPIVHLHLQSGTGM